LQSAAGGRRDIVGDRALDDLIESGFKETTALLAEAKTVNTKYTVVVRKSSRCTRVAARVFDLESNVPSLLPQLTKQKGAFRIFICSLLLGTCVVYGARSHAQEVRRPDWFYGDNWTYQHTELTPKWEGSGRFPYIRKFTVVGTGSVNYRMEVTTVEEYGAKGTTKAMWNISRNLNTYWRESATLPSTELQFLRWPLVVGNTWNFTHPMPDGTNFEWHVKVMGFENVTVPAGNFKAVVVKVEGNSGAHYRQERPLWYSPDARALVKHEWRGYWRSYPEKGMVDELQAFSAFLATQTK